jgi:hypothetical protein
MLAESPLVALDRHAAVLADRHRRLFVPVGAAFPHQLAPGRIDASALLVAGQCRCGGDEPRVQATEQQGLPPQVLGVEGCGHPDRRCPYPWCLFKVLAATGRCSEDTGSEEGYRRPLAGPRGRQSELFIPQAHALEPGIGLLQVPTVIGFEDLGDGDHLNGIGRQRGWDLPQALGN